MPVQCQGKVLTEGSKVEGLTIYIKRAILQLYFLLHKHHLTIHLTSYHLMLYSLSY
jgi:hypothetical protein